MKETVSLENSVEENLQIVCRLKTPCDRLGEELKWKWIKDLWKPYYEGKFDKVVFRKKKFRLPVYEKEMKNGKECVRLWGYVNITIPIENHFVRIEK